MLMADHNCLVHRLMLISLPKRWLAQDVRSDTWTCPTASHGEKRMNSNSWFTPDLIWCSHNKLTAHGPVIWGARLKIFSYENRLVKYFKIVEDEVGVVLLSPVQSNNTKRRSLDFFFFFSLGFVGLLNFSSCGWLYLELSGSWVKD